MKYTILGFQQQKLIDNELDVTDALILNVIKDMYSSNSMEYKVIDDLKYMWINYNYFLSQIPIIGSRSNLMRRIKNYSDKSFLIRVIEFERNDKKGSYAYIYPTEKLFSLSDYEGYVKMTQGVCQNDIRGVSKWHNKDTSIKDTSIIDNNNILSFNNDDVCKADNNSNKELKDNYVDEKEIFDYWNSKLGTIHSQERSFTKDKAKIKTAIKTYGKNEIMTAIERLDKAVLDTNYYYSFKWNIFKFLKQSNGIANWLDDGQLWNSYNANKEVLTTNNKSTGNNEEIEAFLRGDY